MAEPAGETVIAALNQKFPAIKRLYLVKRIGIFGPVAQGCDDPEILADIDVEFETGGDTVHNFISLSLYLEELLGRKVSLVTRRLVADFLEECGGCGDEGTRDRYSVSRMSAEISFLLARKKGLDFRSFSTDEVLRRAVARSLETIGECALDVSEKLQQEHPGIPWTGLTGLKTRLIHPCFGPDWVLVWDFLSSELPGIETRIRNLPGAS